MNRRQDSEPSETEPLLGQGRHTVTPPTARFNDATNNIFNDAVTNKYSPNDPSSSMELEDSLHISSDSIRDDVHVYVAYTRRWYILAIFSLIFVVQGMAWNTLGPIADTAKVVLRWTQADISFCINWGPITFIVTGFFFSFILDVKGFRYAVLLSSLLCLFGAAFRCIPVGIDHFKWTLNIGQIFVGLSAPILLSGPTQLSANWFPPHQRTTSTAISSMAGCLGFAFGFLIGPQVVTNIPKHITADNITAGERANYFSEIMNLMYIECGILAVLVIAALLYFPDSPPTPPSVSAAVQRESFKEGALTLIKQVQFWIPALSYSLSTGMYVGWTTQIDAIFDSTLGVKQDTVGWIGFYGNIAATIGGLAFARLVDIIGGRMKSVLLFLMIGSVGSCVWCVILSMQYIPFNLASLYISCIGIGFFVNASIPIYFEVTVEGMYPVSEGTITMLMTWLNNVWALVLVLLPQIHGIGVIWLNWVFLGSLVVCVPLLLMYKDRYKRLDLDTHDLTNSKAHVDKHQTGI